MNKKQFKILSLIASVVIVFSACSKDVDTPPVDNPANGESTAVFNPNINYGTMTDIDGNTYKTVSIGTQTWMAENLRTTKYKDGTSIPNENGSGWGQLTTGAYCNYDNTLNGDDIATYGRLYNWYAVGTGNLAPDGWHVPTAADWDILNRDLGGIELAGGKLKEIGLTHWISPNVGATNETGFTALSSGYRFTDGSFSDLGSYGFWWSATDIGSTFASYHYMEYSNSYVTKSNFDKEVGFSVRCIKD